MEAKYDDSDSDDEGAKALSKNTDDMDSDEEAAMVEREFKELMSDNQEGEIGEFGEGK